MSLDSSAELWRPLAVQGREPLQTLETKQRILDKSIELFRTSDYEDVNITEICAFAQISVGNFYNHFASKEALLMELYPSFDAYVEKEFIFLKFDSNLDAIKHLIYRQTLAAEDLGSKVYSQVLRVQIKNHGKFVIEDTRPFHIHLRKLVQNALDDGELIKRYTADEIASLLLKISRGTLLDWAMREVAYSITEQALHNIDMFLNSVSRDSSRESNTKISQKP